MKIKIKERKMKFFAFSAFMDNLDIPGISLSLPE